MCDIQNIQFCLAFSLPVAAATSSPVTPAEILKSQHTPNSSYNNHYQADFQELYLRHLPPRRPWHWSKFWKVCLLLNLWCRTTIELTFENFYLRLRPRRQLQRLRAFSWAPPPRCPAARLSVCVVVCCSVLQCVAVCCSVLQCVAVCCSVLQCVAVRFRERLRPDAPRHVCVCACVSVCCCVLLCGAVWCSVVQCGAVCCISFPWAPPPRCPVSRLWGGYD